MGAGGELRRLDDKQWAGNRIVCAEKEAVARVDIVATVVGLLRLQ
jgi:hypothetical protein